jgi:CubicO group peptidase (beta-lactamase class C family)
LFQRIQYRQGGQLKQTSLNDFLNATQTTSFIVIKDGAILDESYANGYTRDSLVTSESDAKSFTSALVGIAINEGDIGSVDDRMVSYLPELRGKGLDDVTIRDLLTMSAGISYAYQNDQPPLLNLLPLNDDARTTNYPDLRRLMLSVRPGHDPPGAAFSYNNAQPLLLGMILERATHRSVAQYLQEKIWQPLGMEYPASWSLDCAQSGFEKMSMGLNARAIDFAKFGQLYLDDGRWNGRQIVPAQWVSESTAPDPADNRIWRRGTAWKQRNGYYKYLWWGQLRPDGSYAYMARGGHAVGQLQWIYVSPKDRVVIVCFGLVDGSADWWPDVFQSVTDRVSR